MRERPLVALTVADLTAWATETPLEVWTRDDLLVHHALVTRIDAAANGCLPARFATPVTEALLRERYADLARALDRVEGCAELAVTCLRGGLTTPEARSPNPGGTNPPAGASHQPRAGGTNPPPRGASDQPHAGGTNPPPRGASHQPRAGGTNPPAGASDQPPPPHGTERTWPGTAYLRMRAATLGLAKRLAEQVELGAGADLVEADHRLVPSEAVLLSSALLVERAAAETVKARLTRVSGDVRILVNGPWPPYSFAVVDVPTREE